MFKKVIFYFVVLIFPFRFFCQNVGVIVNEEQAYDGFTLFSVSKKTFLINNCGEIINEWQSEYNPGHAVYLLKDGTLLRAGNTGSTNITLGGAGGVIELFDWEGRKIRTTFYDGLKFRQHHDIYPMPNGNILILAATIMSRQEAIEAGRNPNRILKELYNEQIIEIEPIGANSFNIVWEWNIRDHLIQNFDETKSNFGDIASNPGRLNINFLSAAGLQSNWLHFNSIQYNEELDQILISSRNLSEIYIIDHSTTTTESASSIGGRYGKGGDFLYRWGNPQAYDRGTFSDQQLFGQHYPHWIPKGFKNEGKIMLFNNGIGRSPSFSEVHILTPPITTDGSYELSEGLPYLPISPDYKFKEESSFYSPFLSSAQMLPNGNILTNQGVSGDIIEINSLNNEEVWRYIIPVNTLNGEVFSTNQSPINNSTFRAIKYPKQYVGFSGRDLTPGAKIERDPLDNCESSPTLNSEAFESISSGLKIYPNPVEDILNIESSIIVKKIELFSIDGQKLQETANKTNTVLNLKNYKKGVYLIKFHFGNTIYSRKVIKN